MHQNNGYDTSKINRIAAKTVQSAWTMTFICKEKEMEMHCRGNTDKFNESPTFSPSLFFFVYIEKFHFYLIFFLVRLLYL